MKDHQDFMKRLRKHIYEEHYKKYMPPTWLSLRKFIKYRKKSLPPAPKIKFFHCGEYGQICRNCGLSYKLCKNNVKCPEWLRSIGRPHFHSCIFGYDFKDKKLHSMKNGIPLHTSETLQKLWPQGYSTIGEVTFESAAYVARYITKKITGDKALDHYAILDIETGEILGDRPKEYITMSRREGIGQNWFKKYKKDVYPDDFLIYKGKKYGVPSYYDNQYELEEPEEIQRIKDLRKAKIESNPEEHTPERLAQKKKNLLERASKLKRNLEND